MTRLPAAPARLIAGAVLAACLALPARAESPAEAQEAGEIASFTLDNGLEIVVIPDHRAPVVTHMLWYKVGSADEEPGKSGIAHFLEHLMFKGTEAHPQGEFSQTIAEVGGRENAFTSYDYTAYYQQVPPELLENMMEFEADRMTGLVLTDEVVAPERQVVIEERSSRIENQPGALLSEALNATLYKNHPYGQPVIGWMHEIKALNRQDAIEFYQRYYAPNNAILVVAGDVEPEAVRDLAEDTYGEIPANRELGPRVRPQEPPHQTARTVTYTDARVSVPSFTENWVVPSYNTAEDGTAEALDLLSEILGGGVHSRLYRSLVVEKGIASSAGAFYRGNALDDSAFGVYGTPRGGADLADVEQAVRAEIEKIVEEGISDEELDAAKNRFVRSMIFARDSQQGMANIYGSALATGSTIEDVQEWPERIRAVDAEAVQAAAARFLDDDRSVTGYLLPETDEEAEGDE